jgi:hypothetical protein
MKMKWSIFSIILGIALIASAFMCNHVGGLAQAFVLPLGVFGVVFLVIGVVLNIKTKGEFKK